MGNFKTIMVSLPGTVKGYVIEKDDFYTIVLNSNLSYEQNIETYRHELRHIYSEDFLMFDADLLELERHYVGKN